MKPILKIKSILCFQDEKGRVFQEFGVEESTGFAWEGIPYERDFMGYFGEYRIKVELLSPSSPQ